MLYNGWIESQVRLTNLVNFVVDAPCPKELLSGSDLRLTWSDLRLTGSDLRLTGSDLRLTGSDLRLTAAEVIPQLYYTLTVHTLNRYRNCKVVGVWWKVDKLIKERNSLGAPKQDVQQVQALGCNVQLAFPRLTSNRPIIAQFPSSQPIKQEHANNVT